MQVYWMSTFGNIADSGILNGVIEYLQVLMINAGCYIPTRPDTILPCIMDIITVYRNVFRAAP